MAKKVLLILPKFGLGNMLLLWARAFVYASKSGLALYVFGWHKIHWGAFIRNEKSKRNYSNYFREQGFISKMAVRLSCIFTKKIYNPTLMYCGQAENGTVVFNQLKTSTDLFGDLRPFEHKIRNALIDLLTIKIKKRLDKLSEPIIAVHIRRGDFTLSQLATPLEYFIEVIQAIRKITESDTAVMIFTDAWEAEIKPLLSLPNVSISSSGADILDILWMSKAKTLILSPSSSFSYWAAFLSNATVIISDSDWQIKIKEDSAAYRELRWKFGGDNKDTLSYFGTPSAN